MALSNDDKSNLHYWGFFTFSLLSIASIILGLGLCFTGIGLPLGVFFVFVLAPAFFVSSIYCARLDDNLRNDSSRSGYNLFITPSPAIPAYRPQNQKENQINIHQKYPNPTFLTFKTPVTPL